MRAVITIESIDERHLSSGKHKPSNLPVTFFSDWIQLNERYIFLSRFRPEVMSDLIVFDLSTNRVVRRAKVKHAFPKLLVAWIYLWLVHTRLWWYRHRFEWDHANSDEQWEYHQPSTSTLNEGVNPTSCVSINAFYRPHPKDDGR